MTDDTLRQALAYAACGWCSAPLSVAMAAG
jgi:hypothetical protein